MFRLDSSTIAVLIVVALFQAATPTSAQDPDMRDLFDLSLSDLSGMRVEVATRTPALIKEAPSTITVFTSADIEAYGVNSVEELMHYVPGFSATRDYERGRNLSVSARGKKGVHASHDILVLLDGMRMNNPFYGGALQFTKWIPVENVERVEVIRGPGAALYGSNAFVGIINIVTKTAGNLAKVEFGEYNSALARAMISNSTEDVTYQLFLGGMKTDGHVYPRLESSTSEVRDPYFGFDIYGKFAIGDIQFSLYNSTRHESEFYLYRFTPEESNRLDLSVNMFNLSYEPEVSDNISLELSATYQEANSEVEITVASAETMTNLMNAGLTEGTAPFLAGPVHHTRMATFEAVSEIALEDHNLVFGVEYRISELVKAQNRNNYELTDFVNVLLLGEPGTIRYYGDTRLTAVFADEGTKSVYGVFGQDTWNISESLSATLGLRWDYYEVFGNTVNPRLALVWQASDIWTLKGLFGQAFRSPSIAELSDINNPVHIGNPDLQPEKSLTTELTSIVTTDEVMWSTTLYHLDVSDRIFEILDSTYAPPPLTYYVNGETFRSIGVETEVEYEFAQWFFSRTTGHYVIDVTDDLHNVPQLTLSTQLSYQQGNVLASVSVLHCSETEQPDAPSLDAYTLIGAKVGYFFGRNIQAYVKVSNAFDIDYRTYETGQKFLEGVQNPGRQVTFGLYLNP